VLTSPEYGTNRYEVLWVRNRDRTFFYKNHLPLEVGVRVLPFIGRWRFLGKVLYELKNDAARESVLALEKYIQTYPYTTRYSMFFGPNSNTFTKLCMEQIQNSAALRVLARFKFWSGVSLGSRSILSGDSGQST
jgi:hypothetical protein